MTLRELLLHYSGENHVFVCDSLSGDVLAHGGGNTVLHTLKADDLIVDHFDIAEDVPFCHGAVLNVEVW